MIAHDASLRHLRPHTLCNAFTGGSEHVVLCNGENSEANDVDMFYGKGLISKKLYPEVRKYKGGKARPLSTPL
mgnify:CR=1 FL=1